MIKTNRFVSFAKTTLLVSAAALMMNACSDKGTSTSTNGSGARTTYETSTDHAIGDPKAPVTIVEYSSVMCGHCATWHEATYPELVTKYVSTGKVRFVSRPFPTGNISLANAGHLLANCAPSDKYFDLIGVQMKRQRQIATSTDIKGEYIALAKSVGMSEAEFDACMSDPDGLSRLQAVYDAGDNLGVTGTPTFFFNGKKEQVFTIEEFETVLAPLLGEPLPKAKPETESETASDTDGKSGDTDN